MASRATEHHRLACMAAATQRTRPLPTRILRRALPILAAELTVGRSPIRLAAKHPSIPSGLAGLGEAALDPKPAVGAGLARLVPDLLVEPPVLPLLLVARDHRAAVGVGHVVAALLRRRRRGLLRGRFWGVSLAAAAVLADVDAAAEGHAGADL